MNPLTNSSADSPPELERAIEALRNGAIDEEHLVRTLLGSQLFVLLDREPKGNTLAPDTSPLVVVGPDGSHGVAAFTSPQRATAVATHNPAFPHGLLASASWLIGLLPPSLSLFINLTGPVPMGFAAAGLQRMRAVFALGAQPQ